MGLEIDTSGINKRLDKLLEKIPQVRVMFLQQLGAVLLVEIHIQVPHDTGLLEASLFAEVSPDGKILTVGTRGCSYAKAVHEAIGKHFTKAGSGPKYIENPVHQLTSSEVFRSISEWAVKEWTRGI